MTQATPARKKAAKPGARARASAASTRAGGFPEPRAPGGRYPVVGIGASAGGLEALEAFFKPVPAVSGIAYVVVQHLDPTHKTMLTELLGRVTSLPVVEVRHGIPLAPDSVFVIPPNADLTLVDGHLMLSEPAAPRGLRLPIDSFFRSLAADRGNLGVGVVLSGMGSDGSLGLRAIREANGLTLVQEPTTAKFDSMPRSALEATQVDIIAAPEELAGKLLSVLRHGGERDQDAPVPPRGSHLGLAKVVDLLRKHGGHDFSSYKKSTAYRRIERRMAIHQLAKMDDYIAYLRDNPQELELLFNELLIGVTRFFRDPVAWDVLENQALPALLAAHPEGRVLRAWVVACSTGEEAYSIAIAFREVLRRLKPKARFGLKIFATDLHEDAIAKARAGVFPPNIAADVAPDRLERYFVPVENGYRIAKDIRQMVTFAPQDVILDPPFTKLDLLSCRNLMIYFEPELQKKLVALFHYSLNPGGVLFLGSAETTGSASGKFEPYDRKTRIYRRVDGNLPALPIHYPTRSVGHRSEAQDEEHAAPPRSSLTALAEHVLLQKFSPAAVLVDAQGDVVFISGRTGKYLEPAAGKANWNVHAMARPGLRHELAAALHKAVRDRMEVVLDRVRIEGDAGPVWVRVVVHFIDQTDLLHGMLMIVFRDLPDAEPVRTKPARGVRAVALQEKLQQVQEENRSQREEMQTAQEELKSTNEELQSANEELQSTNEELTTSREELQSMNEELQMVNHELNAKLDELSWASNDMTNLLNGTGLAAIFLTGSFTVRRFTTHATRIFKLIPSDVGRPLSDIVTDLVDENLIEDARKVLETLVVCERQLAARDGRKFWVRILPYRISDHSIDGVVMTFAEMPT